MKKLTSIFFASYIKICTYKETKKANEEKVLNTRKSFSKLLLTMPFFLNSFISPQEHTKYFKEPSAQYPIKIMPPVIVGEFYQELKVLDQLFNEHGIKYWISFGTLLGAVRHQGMIPWDNDADIEIFENDGEKALKLNPLFKNFGYEIKPWFISGKFVGLRIHSNNIKIKKHPLDIFFSKKVGDKIVLASSHWKGKFLKHFWLTEELEPPSKLKLGPIELNAPNNPIRFIYEFYGKDAMNYCPFRFGGKTIKLTIQDFSPPPYVISESKR